MDKFVTDRGQEFVQREGETDMNTLQRIAKELGEGAERTQIRKVTDKKD